MTQTLRVQIAAGAGALVLAVLATLAAYTTYAASDYNYTMRGFVESVDTTNKTVRVTGTWASSEQAIADTQSKINTYKLSGTPIYRWENGAKVSRNVNYIKTGQEVVIKGRKVSGAYTTDWLIINDNAFDIVGRVTNYDTSENWIKIKVGRSTLKHAGIVNTEIKFYYDSDTTCKRLGTEIGCSEIVNNNQGIKVRGVKSSASQQWDIMYAWNNYPI